MTLGSVSGENREMENTVPTFFNSTILWLIHPWRGRTDIQAQGQDDDVRLDLCGE